MAKKKTKNKIKSLFKIDQEVLVYGGGANSTEFERGNEGTVVEVYEDKEYQVEFDDGHIDIFLEEQLRAPPPQKGSFN